MSAISNVGERSSSRNPQWRKQLLQFRARRGGEREGTVEPAMTAICFPSSTIKFSDGTHCVHASAQGQAFFYFGNDLPAFVRHFGSVGLLVLST
jgi:hypothetical protein